MAKKPPREFVPKVGGKYSVAEIAAYLGVPDSWVYSRTRLNTIPLIRVGKYCRFDLSSIENWSRAGCPAKW
jgi:excisionase family DNA binding protein